MRRIRLYTIGRSWGKSRPEKGSWRTRGKPLVSPPEAPLEVGKVEVAEESGTPAGRDYKGGLAWESVEG